MKKTYVMATILLTFLTGMIHSANAQSCVESVEQLPATCTGGSITSDNEADPCRTVICESAGNSLKVLACNKPDGNPAYVEMYKQSTNPAGLEICLGETCIKDNGYQKSPNFPICTEEPDNETQEPANQTGLTLLEINDLTAHFLCKPDGSSNDLTVDWNFGDGSVVQDTDEQTSHTYSALGSYLVVCDAWDNVNAQFTSLQKWFHISDSTDPPDTPPNNDTDPPTNDTPDACFTNVAQLPATCSSSITSDTLTGGCRKLACGDASNSIHVLACDKPTSSNPEYFEMYRQTHTGTPPELCLGETCIQNSGYSRGTFECTEPEPPVDPPDNTTDPEPPNETQCFENVENIPAMCSGGSITSDLFDGGRHITCSSGGNSLSIDAWDKPSLANPTHFEMYKKSASGSGIEICLGETCLSNSGFARSDTYPICSGEAPPPPSNGINTPPEAPVWLEPLPNATNVDTVDFHIQAFEMEDAQGDTHIASDFEVWDDAANQRVWAIDHTTNPALLTHVHNGDGVFQGNLAGQNALAHDTTYRLRARYYADSASNDVSPWSVWVYFTTKSPSSDTGGDVLWTAREGYTVELVASNINTPVNIAPAPHLYNHLPEGAQPHMYVTQLYGQVGVLKKDGSYSTYADDLLNYNVLGSIPGSGETGVDGLYVDPSGDLFVSMVYTDSSSRTGYFGKVVRFDTNGNGDGHDGMSTILSEIEVAPSHHIHQIARGADGKLYVGVGDAHDTSAAKDTSRTAGKILRFNEDGSVPSDNPIDGNYFYAGGFRNPFGLAFRPGTNELFVTNNGASSDDGIYKVDEGDIFGWCCDTASGTWHLWPDITAPTQVAFGSGIFPSSSMYVALSGHTYGEGPDPIGKRIVEFTFNADGSKQSEQTLVTYTGEGHGAPIGIAFADDGMYFTDIYGEQGFVGVGQTRGNIYRVVEGSGPGPTQPPDEFEATIAPKQWYPQGLEVVWVCKAVGGSEDYSYSFDFGDGAKTGMQSSNNIYHTYSEPGQYTVSCTARDNSNGEMVSGSTTVTLQECQPEDFQCN